MLGDAVLNKLYRVRSKASRSALSMRIDVTTEGNATNGDVSPDIVIDRPLEIVARPRIRTQTTCPNGTRSSPTNSSLRGRCNVGSRIVFVAHFLLAHRRPYTYEITELSPNRLVMRTARGPQHVDAQCQQEGRGVLKRRLENE